MKNVPGKSLSYTSSRNTPISSKTIATCSMNDSAISNPFRPLVIIRPNEKEKRPEGNIITTTENM